MHILIIDRDPASRATLYGRVQLATRQADLRRVQLTDCDLDRLSLFKPDDIDGCIVGPGCYETLDHVTERVRSFFPDRSISVILDNETYANYAVGLRKAFGLRVIPIGDLAQIASFLIDCENEASRGGSANSGVIGVAQLKGGVGATTITAALASCYSKNGLSVCAIDLDDVNPQLTDWGRVGQAQRQALIEFLKKGDIPAGRQNEILFPIDGFDGRFNMIGQPQQYSQAFHFKADVIEGAPSSAQFIDALIPILREEFDVVLIDFGRSWGVSTIATFKYCQEILLVTDDDGMSVRRTLDCLQRLKRESDDPNELDLNRWSIILNAYTGRLISPNDLAAEIQEMDLLPPEASLYTIPFSERGRLWGAPGQTLFELCEENVRSVITKLACNLVAFRYANNDSDLLGKVESFVRRWRHSAMEA